MATNTHTKNQLTAKKSHKLFKQRPDQNTPDLRNRRKKNFKIYTDKHLFSKLNLMNLGYQHRNLWRMKKKVSIDPDLAAEEEVRRRKKTKKLKDKRIAYLVKIGALRVPV